MSKLDLESILRNKHQTPKTDDYRAFGKARAQGLVFFSIYHTNGIRDLIPYSTLGMIKLIPSSNLVLIPSAEQIIIIQGSKLDQMLDYLQYRELEFLRVLQKGQDYDKEQPIINNILYQKLKKSELSDELPMMEKITTELQTLMNPD